MKAYSRNVLLFVIVLTEADPHFMNSHYCIYKALQCSMPISFLVLSYNSSTFTPCQNPARDYRSLDLPGHVLSACFSSNNKSLDVDCGAGYMVHITKTFYGFSPSGQCRRLDSEASTGCTFDDQTRYPCIGHRTCSINLPTGQLGVNVPACGQRSNYFQMEYTCVLGEY